MRHSFSCNEAKEGKQRTVGETVISAAICTRNLRPLGFDMVDDRRNPKQNAMAKYKSLRIAIEIYALLRFDMVGDRRYPKNLDAYYARHQRSATHNQEFERCFHYIHSNEHFLPFFLLQCCLVKVTMRSDKCVEVGDLLPYIDRFSISGRRQYKLCRLDRQTPAHRRGAQRER